MSNIQAIIDDFQFLDDWEDRYKYLIELGNALAELPKADHNGATKVNGCVSQVWIKEQADGQSDPILTFRGDSDAHIVRGLIAIAIAIYSGKRASEIITIDAHDTFSSIGLKEHITPQRSNGLISMVKRIQDTATAYL